MNDRSPAHAALTNLEYEDGILLWGGRKVSDLAKEIGATPFYAYDSNHMTQRVADLRQAMPEKLHIHYAMKANPMPDVVNHMAQLVDGLDVASENELQVALGSGTRPENISFAGPGKRDAELASAIVAGITLNIESLGEMRKIAAISERLNLSANVAVRVNPAFELRTAGMKMGGRPSQFGVDAEHVPDLLKKLASAGLNYRGMHIFSGSQNLRSDAIIEALEKTVDLVLSISQSSSMSCASVNLGGGFGIPYFPSEQPLDISLLRDSFGIAVDRLSCGLNEPEIIIELGRYLVGESGIYVCKVIDLKDSRGTRFAICDGGLHHHLAATGNFGQILRKNYPIVAVDRNSDHSEKVTVVGPLCTPLDLLGDGVSLQDIKVGSLIAILQSGAYGATASPLKFLSHPACIELLIDGRDY